MKINTITCHDVYNFGASLQAYALMHYLQLKGHEVEIIDYYPKYKHINDVFYLDGTGIAGTLGLRFPFLAPLLALFRNRHYFNRIPNIIKFRKFKRRYLKCTPHRYRSIDDFKLHYPSADLYIAGSDQIWNTQMQNGLDPVFYCLFEKDCNKCISYAASFAISNIPEEHREIVNEGLRHLSAISVREKSGVSIVNSFGLYATVVLDPVLLLKQEDWESILPTGSALKHPYLLVYDLTGNDSLLQRVAQRVANKLNLSIVSIYKKVSYSNIHINSVGPSDFVSFIRNSSFVVANSFHATAFSVIFRKPFYTVPLPSANSSSRMKDFLESIGLCDRFLIDESSLEEDYNIDYSLSESIITCLQEQSRLWLLKQISERSI